MPPRWKQQSVAALLRPKRAAVFKTRWACFGHPESCLVRVGVNKKKGNPPRNAIKKKDASDSYCTKYRPLVFAKPKPRLPSNTPAPVRRQSDEFITPGVNENRAGGKQSIRRKSEKVPIPTPRANLKKRFSLREQVVSPHEDSSFVQHESSDHPDPPPHTVADSSSQLDLGLIDSDSEEDMCPNFSIPIHSRNPDSRTNRKEEKKIEIIDLVSDFSKSQGSEETSKLREDRLFSRNESKMHSQATAQTADADSTDDELGDSYQRRSKRSPRRPLARIFADRASSRMKPLSPSKCNIRANNRNGMRRRVEPCVQKQHRMMSDTPSLASKREAKGAGLNIIPAPSIVGSVDGDDDDDDDDEYDSEDEPCRPSLAPKREVKRVGLKKIPPRYIVHSSDDDDDDHDSEDEDDPYMKRFRPVSELVSADDEDDPYMKRFRPVSELVSAGILNESDVNVSKIMSNGRSRKSKKSARASTYTSDPTTHFVRSGRRFISEESSSFSRQDNSAYSSNSRKGKGYWVTLRGGQKQYIAGDGRKLTGSAAYKAYRTQQKENGGTTSGKKAKTRKRKKGGKRAGARKNKRKRKKA
eukprot:jgi/Bigna1/86531/estExt_fgenesh1_pg.C_110125